MMNTRYVDVAIVGAGSAGMSAYREARKVTNNIALIEGGPYGTTCARVGCMPSKLLIAAAEAAHAAQHAEVFGLQIPRVGVDGAAVMDRVRRERDRFVGFVVDDIEGFDPQHHVRGYAVFQDAHTLLVNAELKVVAKRIVLATGSRPFVPDLALGAGERLLVNDDVFALQNLPASVVVLGAGVIALELGQALSRLNVKVTMLARSDSLGGLVDAQIRDYATRTFAEEFDLNMNTRLLGVETVANGVRVDYETQDGIKMSRTVDYVLAATGRVPNIDRLNIEVTGLQRDDRGVPVFDHETMQTQVPHIFIAGDANNTLPLLHEASDEGRIAGRNAANFPQVKKGLRRAGLSVVFSDPQIASIGQQGSDLPTDAYVVGEVSFENQGRSRVMAKNKGMLKVYVDLHTRQLLGAEMFGPAAEHIGHLLAWAVQQSLTVDAILDMPFYHPVIEEGVRSAFRDAAAKLQQVSVTHAKTA